jgi:hypothetical protein
MCHHTEAKLWVFVNDFAFANICVKMLFKKLFIEQNFFQQIRDLLSSRRAWIALQKFVALARKLLQCVAHDAKFL